ncbi:hypothetical protein JHD49_08460 [Sulfurimonas sp. SAG-AH-194-C21]|nr:hypothetical protein [Sulfurimonas sp. SAG-AH-194-C21]MDF1883967.1 hypothetical protein [Sulfurimonas sp. SAG-AH-194-C21]
MIKFLLSLVMFSSLMMAKSYQFSEVRYSDALSKSINLHGIITFGDESLDVFYEKSKNRLVYEDEELFMYENEEDIDLGESERVKIVQYFEIIILLYEGDKSRLQENFTIKTEGTKTLLLPKDEMSNYISKIKLVHEKEELKSLKLYLTNDDTIKISIEDEVR